MLRRPPLAFTATCLALALAALGLGATGGFGARSSSHFELQQNLGFERYSGPSGSLAFERAVLAVLEDAHARVRDELHVEPRYKVHVSVYAPDAFDALFARRFGFRAAGFWDGSMNVRGGQSLDERLVSTLHHEYVHAALESVAPRESWPAWLNEGMAEFYERRALGVTHLTGAEDQRLRVAVATGSWIPLADLSGPTLASLSQSDAELAYLESYAAIELAFRARGVDRMRALVREMGRTRAPERALESALRVSLAQLESELVAELR
jgi:hypothetical protein